MNLLLLFPEDLGPADPDGTFPCLLTGRRAAHLREVLRAEPGRTLRVGVLEGRLGDGVVRAPEPGDPPAAVRLSVRLAGDVPPRPGTDLLLAIPREKSLRKLLPEVTALGIDRLVLLRSWRVEKPYLSQRILLAEEQAPLLHEGLMQARSVRIPRVTVEPLFRPFVEDRLRDFVADGARASGGVCGSADAADGDPSGPSAARADLPRTHALVAHPGAAVPLASLRIGRRDRVVLAVGPEGGWVPFEVDAFARAGFVPVSAGERILRVETACVALLAQIDLLRNLDAQGDVRGPVRPTS